jgi:hypothetical protein
MKLPHVPVPEPISSVTPSFYNVILRCKAKAVWVRFGVRNSFPVSPFALLGTAFHMVTEASARGNLPDEESERREAAYALFEQEALRLLNASHPFVRRQFSSAHELPYFYRLQAQAAEASVAIGKDTPASHHASAQNAVADSDRFAERKFVSRDGKINGRIDLVDASAGVIYDYKSGAEPEAVTDAEARQMRLYAYLCAENDIPIERAVIVRRNGRQDDFLIAPEDAKREAEAAIGALNVFNQAANGNFREMASPSPSSCEGCPCLALCERFWEEAAPEWAAEVGLYAEGEVQSVRRSGEGSNALITLQMSVSRGTTTRGVDTMFPSPAWASEADGDEPLRAGDVIRIMGAKAKLESAYVPSLSHLPGNKMAEIWRVN